MEHPAPFTLNDCDYKDDIFEIGEFNMNIKLKIAYTFAILKRQ